jgi:xylulokinase
MGIDVGTGGTRALLVDQHGRVRHTAMHAHEDMRMEKPLWAEQDPDDWWAAAQAAVRAVLNKAHATGEDIRGIGLSGQMHGLTLLDETNRVIRPALIWCDQRSQAQVDGINAIVGVSGMLEATANPVLTGFTLPKLLWVRDNEPANYARVRHVLLPKDYVRFGLTGEYASDVSDASGTALFNVVKRQWALDLASKLGVDAQVLPRVYESDQVTGHVTKHAADSTGLKPGTPVVGGAGDQAASAVGNGIVTPGVVSCTLGTSGVVFSYLRVPNYDERGRVHTFCHAVQGAWHVMGVTQGAGLSLQWFRKELSPGVEYDALMDEAAQSDPGAKGLFWLPYLMGERTPHLDSSIRGGWIGLTASHKRADLIRSLIEGVCYSQKDCLDLVEMLGGAVTNVRVSGGGARSAFWRQVLANVLNREVVRLETEEGSAYGAALLALAGCEHAGDVRAVCAEAIKQRDSVAPDPHESTLYAEGHKKYQSLYPAVKQALA